MEFSLQSQNLLGEKHPLATLGAAVRTVGIRGLAARDGLRDSLGLDLRHWSDVVEAGLRGESGSSTSESVASGAEITSVTGRAEYLFLVTVTVCAVQGLLALGCK